MNIEVVAPFLALATGMDGIGDAQISYISYVAEQLQLNETGLINAVNSELDKFEKMQMMAIERYLWFEKADGIKRLDAVQIFVYCFGMATADGELHVYETGYLAVIIRALGIHPADVVFYVAEMVKARPELIISNINEE